MIRPGEIQQKANRLGVRDQQIEKDYILSWILQGLSQHEEHPEYIPDVMRNGDVQPHDMVGYYFSMNIDPRMFVWARNIKSIVPNSIPYWPDN